MSILLFFKIKQLTLRVALILTQATLSVGTTFERTIDDAAGDSVSGLLPVYTPTNGLSPVCPGIISRNEELLIGTYEELQLRCLHFSS